MDLKRLLDPFPASDVEWRIGRAGQNDKGIWAMALAYITNRAIMQRLDEVCGPENWRNEFREGPGGGVICGISIRIGDEWVTKWDGAENTDVEGVKGGLSGAMKRAAVQWGIGRYLYDLEEGWATISDRGRFRGQLPKGGPSFRWDPPELPAWALPNGANGAAPSAPSIAPPPSTQKARPSPTTPTPTCPKCDGAMWDNRKDNDTREANGEKLWPDFKCKDRDCDGIYWRGEWPGGEDAGSDAEAKDQIVAGIQSRINEMKGLDAEAADAAQEVLNRYIEMPKTTASALHRLATNIQTKLDELHSLAGVSTDSNLPF